jgi:proteasome accessory factor B
MTAKLSRPPLARMMRIHEALGKDSFPNCSTLAREIEVTVKTIQRDIEFMRDQLGLPIEYDPSRKGYGYTEKVAGFPTMQVSEGELMALLVAGKALAQYRGTPYERQLKAAFEKLAAGLDGTISFTPGVGLATMSFGGIGQAEADLAVFEPLSRAVAGRREIEFDYRKPGSVRPIRRHVQPYHLAYRDNLCYVIGRDVSKKALRQFALPRMSRIAVRKERFVVPADFSPEEYFKGAFGAQGGDGDYHVRIRFDASAAFYIRERRWHPTQELTELSNGGVELSLRLATLDEVERWILSWGAHAEVLAPDQLTQQVHDIISRMLIYYKSALL